MIHARILALIALIFVWSGLCLFSGYQYAQRGKVDAIVDQLEADAEVITEIREVVKWRTKKVTEYVDRIQTVQVEGECFDAPVPDTVDEWLFSTYSATARSQTDRGLWLRPVSLAGHSEDVGFSPGSPVESGGGV